MELDLGVRQEWEGEEGGGRERKEYTLLMAAEVEGCEAAVTDGEFFGGCCWTWLVNAGVAG